MSQPSSSEQPSTPPPSAEPKKPAGVSPKVRRGLLAAAMLIVVAGVIFGVYYLVHGRFIMSTDDAYLRADSVTVSPRVSGYIEEVLVKENQDVVAGQPLVRIDVRNYRDTLSQQHASVDARGADIEAAERKIDQQQAAIEQSRAQLTGAEASLAFAREQVRRYKTLNEQGAETDEKLAQLKSDERQQEANERSALANVHVAERTLLGLRSQVQQAKAQLESAKAQASSAQQNVEDTLIKASVSGRIGDSSARVGQYTQAGTRLMSVVPVTQVYLLANFKETQLAHMRVGQPAKVRVDALGDVDIDAEVESFAPGTGAQFALLPPENATGNFIKIVQRVPVRLRLKASKDILDRLVPGLSVTVNVNTEGAPTA